MEEYNIESCEEWTDNRIDKVLSEYFADYSRSFLKKLFEDGKITEEGLFEFKLNGIDSKQLLK